MGKAGKKLCLILAIILAMGLAVRQIRKEQARMRELNRQAEKLESAMEALGPGEAERERNLAKWYNYNLELGTSGLEEIYDGILNFGQGGMAVLEVPEWELKLAVYHGTGGIVTHDRSTPLPLGGRGKHTVLVLSEPLPWTEGMGLYIACMDQRLIYRVESVQVMVGRWSPERPTEAGQDLLTFVYDRGDTRTLVRCVRSSEQLLWEEKVADFLWLKGLFQRFLS